MDVIFVHGLTGDPVETWQFEDESEFWPRTLYPDNSSVAIYALGYPATIFKKWSKKEMDMFERARNALEYIVAKGIGNRPIVFVSHSLGGILTKLILRVSSESQDNDWKKICNATRLVFFLSTPHTGTSIGSVLKIIFPRLSSKHAQFLSNDNSILYEINSNYRDFANGREDLSTVSYYEKHVTRNFLVVVPRDSADPGLSGTQPIPVDKDHMGICKPPNTEDFVYLSIKRRIDTLLHKLESSGVNSLADDYGTKSENDRRNLLEKLVDAGREHEYSIANNYQNQFARRYMKLGLFTTAREEHDNILAEVEQRFVTHVYHPLICRGATDESIAEALQTKVIDPMANVTSGHTQLNKLAILSALYFLTEQCHVRWDLTR